MKNENAQHRLKNFSLLILAFGVIVFNTLLQLDLLKL
jgi:hypothetical protein